MDREVLICALVCVFATNHPPTVELLQQLDPCLTAAKSPWCAAEGSMSARRSRVVLVAEDKVLDDNGREELLRTFLEQHPLYAACRFKTSRNGDTDFSSPETWPNSIMLPCSKCARETSWSRVEQVMHLGRWKEAPHVFYEDNFVLHYACVRCDKGDAAFWCSVETEGTRHCVRKQGQSPAWSIEPAKDIAKALPAEAIEFYRKGLICTSHNFGLAAVAYFRRVVEQVTGHLLDLVEEHAKEHADQATLDALAEARRAFPATDRLKHAATLLPASLRRGGENPLAKLYDSYSEGVHSLTDDECLEVAREVQAGLDYLLPSLYDQLAKARAYQAAMAKTKRRKAPPSEGS